MELLKRIINWLFYETVEEEPVTTKRSTLAELDFNKKGDILIHQKIESPQEFNEVVNYTSNQNQLPQQELIKAIAINIQFLERLILKLENSVYIVEYDKVKSLLVQSQNCLKISQNLNNSQIFYKNTMKLITQHTLIISNMIKDVNKLESKGLL